MILGAVLAGGRSSRFGSDKALAEIGGATLLERAVAALERQCDSVIVVGRSDAPVETVPDWPRPDCGPLGGIAGALRHAETRGFASVLTCGVDSLDLPADLLESLSPGPAFLASQPVIGHWPATAFAAVRTILEGEGRHSMRAFAEAIGARAVEAEGAPRNINTLADLKAAGDAQDFA